MICDFMSFSAVFQSYEDDGKVIMKGGCAMKPCLHLKRFLPLKRIEPRTAALNPMSLWAPQDFTELISNKHTVLSCPLL